MDLTAVLCVRKEILQRSTCYDSSKSTFVDGALDMGFHVISHFRDDVFFAILNAPSYTMENRDESFE